MSRFSKIFKIILELGWLAIFGLSPIFFCLWVYGTWQIGEYFLFQVLTEIILFIWILKVIVTLEHWNIVTFKKAFSIRSLLPAIIFIFILGLSTLFSQAPYHSFWGSYNRKLGYILWLHGFIFFLVLFFNLKTKKQVQRIFYVIIATTTIVVIYGFLQILGLDPFCWAEPAFLTGRIFSTFGQPNFLASWLLLAIPIVVWLMIKVAPLKDSILKSPLIISLFLLSIFALVLTQSRGAWIGFFFAFFFFSIIFAFISGQKRLAKLLGILLAITIVVVGYLNFSPYPIKSSQPITGRLLTFGQLKETGKLRLIWWRNSLDLIKARPVLGYGPETQRFNFVRFYEPEFAALEAINSYPDRAHNDILDMLLTSGILGLAAYLFLITSAFYLGLRFIFRKVNSVFTVYSSQFTVLILLTGLVGYLISVQFSFHLIPTLVYFWGYLAIISKPVTRNL